MFCDGSFPSPPPLAGFRNSEFEGEKRTQLRRANLKQTAVSPIDQERAAPGQLRELPVWGGVGSQTPCPVEARDESTGKGYKRRETSHAPSCSLLLQAFSLLRARWERKKNVSLEARPAGEARRESCWLRTL